MVSHIQASIEHVRQRFPRVHRVAVGDLSAKFGGLLSGHFSHQSGRDVDLGLYYRKRPLEYPQRFTRASGDNLHFRATWALLEALAATISDPEGVEWILLDYRVQRTLYSWLQRHGVNREALGRMFQYPHGPDAKVGLVRHFPGHDNHLHVRFKCPATDQYCQPSMGPFEAVHGRRIQRDLLAEDLVPGFSG
jgi:murein endopeptidase